MIGPVEVLGWALIIVGVLGAWWPLEEAWHAAKRKCLRMGRWCPGRGRR